MAMHLVDTASITADGRNTDPLPACDHLGGGCVRSVRRNIAEPRSLWGSSAYYRSNAHSASRRLRPQTLDKKIDPLAQSRLYASVQTPAAKWNGPSDVALELIQRHGE